MAATVIRLKNAAAAPLVAVAANAPDEGDTDCVGFAFSPYDDGRTVYGGDSADPSGGGFDDCSGTVGGALVDAY
jgi:hypothetical protein